MMLNFVLTPEAQNPFVSVEEYTTDQWKDALRDLIDDPNAEVEILSISKWQVNEVSVRRVSSLLQSFC